MQNRKFRRLLPAMLVVCGLLPASAMADPKVLIHIQGHGYVDSQHYRSHYHGMNPRHVYPQGNPGIRGHRSFGYTPPPVKQHYHRPPMSARDARQQTVAPDSNVRPRTSRHHSYNFQRGR